MFLKSLLRIIFIASLLIAVTDGVRSGRSRGGRRDVYRTQYPDLETVIRAAKAVGAACVLGCIFRFSGLMYHYGDQLRQEDQHSFTYALDKADKTLGTCDCTTIEAWMLPIAHLMDNQDVRWLRNAYGSRQSSGFCSSDISKSVGNKGLALAVNMRCRQPNIDLSGQSAISGITLESIRRTLAAPVESPQWWWFATSLDLSRNQDITSLRGIRSPWLKKLILNDIWSFERDAFVSVAEELPALEELQLRGCSFTRYEEIWVFNLPSTLKTLDLTGSTIRRSTMFSLFEQSKTEGFGVFPPNGRLWIKDE
eukprot:828424_1